MMRKVDIQALVGIGALYLVLELSGITCPIRFLTGISCAGCGMSRAWWRLLHGDLAAAFSFHPLFWLPVPAAVLLLLRQRLPERAVRLGLTAVVILFLVVYAARLCAGDPIVTCAPTEGLLWKLLSRLAQ